MDKLIRALVLLISILSFTNCKSYKQEQENAHNLFLKYLNILENPEISTHLNRQDLIKSIEDISHIQSYSQKQYDEWKFALNYNIEDWNEWLELNRENIRFNENTRQFYIDGENKFVDKNPASEYNRYLNILRDNDGSLRGEINVDHLDFAYQFFSRLTGYSDFSLDENWGERVPKQKDYIFLESWLAKNQNHLVWDKNNHMVILE